MALRDIFRRKVAEDAVRVKAEGDVTFTPQLVEMLQLFDGTAASYGTVYRKLQPVRTVVDFIADAVADTPLKFFRREEGGREEEREHRVARLLRNPNPGLTTQRLVFGTIADLAVYGQAYWHFMPNPDRLVPIPPHRVTPKGGDFVAPGRFEVWGMDGGAPRTFSAAEIIHFHLYDPEDRRVGSSKLAALRNILNEEIEASRHRRGYWANAARTGGWLEYPENVSFTPEQLGVLRESMQGGYGGADNAGKVGIVERGGHFNKDGFSPRDSEFLAGRLFVLEATARVFNLPLSLLSLTNTSTYASQREFHKQLYMDVLPPWYKRITEELALQLFPWFTDTADLYGEFVPDAKLWGDPVDRIDVLNKAIGRPHMTVREGRMVENFPDRGEPRDDELVVPVGPNFALESMAPTEAAPAELTLVASMPEERLRHQLTEFFAHQERAIASKGGPFEHARWNRALAPLLGEERAERVNLHTAIELQQRDLHEVFAEAKHVRARTLATEASEVAV